MRKTLPARYYLAHFHEFLQYFEGDSKPLLTAQAQAFIENFNALSADAQCIIARAANRKYAVVNRFQFSYEEIDSPQMHIDALYDAGWFGDLANASLSDIGAVLKKDDIVALLGQHQSVKGLNSLKKAELLALLDAQVNTHGWPEEFESQAYLVRQFDEVLQYLLFLYFGHTRGRLNQFSMRDLGIMRTRADAAGQAARFENKEDAWQAFELARGIDGLKLIADDALPALAAIPWQDPQSPLTAQLLEKYLYQLSCRLLTVSREQGLALLRTAPGDTAREKWIREAYKDGDKESVQRALEAIIDNPSSDTLLAFAEDFYARKYHKKRTSVVTDMLRNASRVMQVDQSQNQSVEKGVVSLYKRQGVQAWRTENRLWRALFGLTFWQMLFEQDALITEFDRRPQCLRYNRFYADYSEQIEHLLTSFSDTSALMKHVTTMAATHYGKVNSVFMWRRNMLELLRAFLDVAPLKSVITMLRMMSEDYATLKDGFPDIMVLEDSRLRFEEIKAPGDQLRRNQLVTIQRLQQAGFDVQITQVKWFRDPMQPYAVVDIETTGGKAEYHRITEIGIAKMVNGEIVDTWQTLLNPQRRIPSMITRLTGIDDEMVADAPLFSDIAESLEAFTQDCVFVAHNVNFDYSFIRQEFARLEQPFRRPKLCTVREMRRAKPGLPSYSLAALTSHFEISMQRHHRAMSDALAAAELLKIVQQSDEETSAD